MESVHTIEMRGIGIEFPGVKALSDVDFSVRSGEIRAVVGANGAGKSTLMKVLAGANANYTGTILIDGETVEIRDPRHAKLLGIEIVYQEVDMALFPYLSVAENIMFNSLVTGMRGSTFINWPKLMKSAEDILLRLKMKIDVSRKVSSLSLAEKQMILIARAVRESCRFLILDEPTAPLSLGEVEELFRIVRDLKEKEGVGVIFISHRLPELFQICDSLTVMKDGRIVANRGVDERLTIQDIVTLMLGRSFEENFPKIKVPIDGTVLEAKKLCDEAGKVKNVSLNVAKGEIVGLCGLVGAGKTELCKLLFGANRCAEGEILLAGRPLRCATPTQAVKNKIALVPEERRKEGVLVAEPVYSNLSAACLGKFCGRLSFVNRKKELQNAEKLVGELGIKTPSVHQKVRLLSGGNQQKVAVGKWLTSDSDVYILDEPTKGVDVGAKRDIFQLIQNLAAKGKAVLYASSEINEILAITDRIYVMYNGSVSAELPTADTTEEEILFYATGGDK
ncbi:MAG TPA: sugar ABC transporter ATP-binding protein [Rectinemataceae bacterium]